MNPTERAKRRHIRQILYEYRLRYGVPAELYLTSVGDINIETGDKAITFTCIQIPQLITESVDLIKKFEYDISFIKANSNFAYGAFFEVGDRFAILDSIFLPSEDTQIGQNDYFVYNSRRYDPKKIQKLDGDTGYLLQLRSISGTEFNQVYNKFVRSSITIEQEIDGEL